MAYFSAPLMDALKVFGRIYTRLSQDDNPAIMQTVHPQYLESVPVYMETRDYGAGIKLIPLDRLTSSQAFFEEKASQISRITFIDVVSGRYVEAQLTASKAKLVKFSEIPRSLFADTALPVLPEKALQGISNTVLKVATFPRLYQDGNPAEAVLLDFEGWVNHMTEGLETEKTTIRVNDGYSHEAKVFTDGYSLTFTATAQQDNLLQVEVYLHKTLEDRVLGLGSVESPLLASCLY